MTMRRCCYKMLLAEEDGFFYEMKDNEDTLDDLAKRSGLFMKYVVGGMIDGEALVSFCPFCGKKIEMRNNH